MALFACCAKFGLLLLVISAVPIAFIIHQETAKPATHVYQYHSSGWLRECAKWDDVGRRFIVSFFEGGLGQISLPEDHSDGTVLQETVILKDSDYAGNSSLGILIDRPRNRLLVAIADVVWNRYSALAAYDLNTWNRLFLTQLSGPEDEKALADDVAIDTEGNAYVTDTKASKIWKVGVNGEFLSTLKSPLFKPKEWYKNLVGLNGIDYHENGYFLVVHSLSGDLFKIDPANGDEVNLVKVLKGGSLTFGDGIELISPTKLVVAGNPTRLVESLDDWETANVVGKFQGPFHRMASASTVKDGKIYLNHVIGLGYPKRKHAIIEAVFST